MTPSRTARLRETRRDQLHAVALFTAALVLYFATSSSHLGGGDSAEFVTIFAKGGVAHPSGYPLYCILLRLVAWMPGGAVLGSSRVSALLGALSVPALYLACRGWGASSTGSVLATASYAASALAWRLATEAEVFALNALFASLLLCVAAPGLAIAPVKRLLLLAGLAGLSLSNQMTSALLAPVGLAMAARALLLVRSRVWAALAAVASFGAGLLPYLYCYEVARASDGRYVWGEPGTWRGLLRHVTRADYGTFQLTAAGQSPHPLSNLGLYLTQTGSHALVLPLVVGVFGFGWTYARPSVEDNRRTSAARSPSRRDVLALFATWALAGPVFAASLNVAPDALGATLMERFCLLPEVVLTIAVAWGLDAWPSLRSGRVLPFVLVAAAIVAGGGLHSWPLVRAEHSDALEVYTENTKNLTPPRSVIFGTGDYRLFSFLYADAIELRPDVTYIDPHLLGYGWYRARASSELGASIAPPLERSTDVIALVDLAFSVGRPVFVTDIFEPSLANAFASYPLGTLIRLLPRGAARPGLERVEQENLAVFAMFQRWDATARDDAWANAVLPTYERPWIALARMFERRGDEARARGDRKRAEEWGDGTAVIR